MFYQSFLEQQESLAVKSIYDNGKSTGKGRNREILRVQYIHTVMYMLYELYFPATVPFSSNILAYMG